MTTPINWQRACPLSQRAALVILPWTNGVTVAYQDKSGNLYGCRDISWGVDHEACLNAWTTDAIKQKLKIVDQRGFPRFLDWMREHVGPNWCVSPRTTPNLEARYGKVLTPKRYAAFEAAYRAKYGALHVIGIG